VFFCGLVSKNLAIKSGIRDIERLFVAGLLQNFGELIVAKVSADIAHQCEQYNSQSLPWQLQEQLLGFTYTDISADLLKVWQLPEKIIMPIRFFNDAQNIQINKDVKVLFLASRLALIDSDSDNFTYEALIDESLCNTLGLSSDDLIQATEIASKEAESILSMMNPKLFSK